MTVSGPMTWGTSSSIVGTGTIRADGGLNISGNVVLIGRTLINAAAAVWSDKAPASFSLSDGAVLLNAPGATWDLAFDGIIQSSRGANKVINAGLFRKTAGTGMAPVSIPFINTGTVELQSGTMNFSGDSGYTQNEGVTRLRGGNIANTSPLRIQHGLLQGSGLISGDVISSGIVSPGASPGQIIISGSYTQTADGALNIEIAGPEPITGFDQLIVSNTMTLGGTLNVTFTNGFYPAANTSFPFLTSANFKGTFATFNYPSNEVGMALGSTGSHVVLQVINTRPVIPPIANQSVTNFSLLRVAANAVDNDAPAQALTYSLTDSPPGAVVDESGVITWRPVEFRTPLTERITVLVTDNGAPNLTSSRTFEVLVLDAGIRPAITLQPGFPGNHSLTLTVAGTPGSRYVTQYATNLPGSWFNLATNIAGANGLWSVVDLNATNFARFYRTLPVLFP